MSILFSLVVVLGLGLVAYVGIAQADLHVVFGIAIPYAAFGTFLIGVVYRVLWWARSPVPFRITTTCGQQKSLSWIKSNKLENPSSTLEVVGRMVLEVLFFRSLFRNTRSEIKDKDGPKIVYGPTKWLWAAGLAFHWTFLVIFIRHFKFFAEPVPGFVLLLQSLDSFFQIGLPLLYITDIIFLLAVGYLFLRRIFIPQVRYISLAADYFPLLLIAAIACTGMYMRYVSKVDIVGIKELATGLLSFHPTIPSGLGALFFVHLFFVSVLMAYFPFSKLMHMGGVFLSPTRNLANNNRMVRHVNPWNYPVKTHSYEAYENEFRELMREAGLPLDKDIPAPQEEVSQAKAKAH